MYHFSFIVKRCTAICFDLQEVIIRRIWKNSVLVLECSILIWIHIIKICFIFEREYYLIVKYTNKYTLKYFNNYSCSYVFVWTLRLVTFYAVWILKLHSY
jgi:hypothetical protein